MSQDWVERSVSAMSFGRLHYTPPRITFDASGRGWVTTLQPRVTKLPVC